MIRWPLQPLQPFQKTQLQPPSGPSVDSPCHPWFTTTNLSYRFPILETSATALCGTTGIALLNLCNTMQYGVEGWNSKVAYWDRRNFLDPIGLQYCDPNTTVPQLTTPQHGSLEIAWHNRQLNHGEWKGWRVAMTWISICDMLHVPKWIYVFFPSV